MSAADDEFDSYDWDDEKSEQTYIKNGIDFDFASRVFESEDGFVQCRDTRDYDEARYVATGEVDEMIVTVVWTPRGRARRIITARPATKREKSRYLSGYRKTIRARGAIE
jgi:uncharacterized protein